MVVYEECLLLDYIHMQDTVAQQTLSLLLANQLFSVYWTHYGTVDRLYQTSIFNLKHRYIYALGLNSIYIVSIYP